MKLEQLAPEKKEKLLRALYKEYANNGYKNASTNVIVKEAGISKGSLFNYVGNKTEQYCYLIEDALHMFQDKLSNYMNEGQVPEDYFDRLLYRSNMKIRLSLEYPLEYKLLFDAYLEDSEEIKAFMASQYAVFSKMTLAQGKDVLDPQVLKNPQDRDKVVEMVFHLIAGYSENFLRTHQKIQKEDVADILRKMTTDLQTYFDVIKKGFFK